jgi:hypothetical protein
LRTLLAVRFASLAYQPRLFNCAIDFRVLSDGNQPRATLSAEHKQEHPPPWVLCSGIAQQLPVHVSDGDVVAQEANINLVELRRTVLEDSVIRPISFGDFWRICRNNAVGVGMLRLYGLPACPHDTCDIDELSVRRKELTKGIHIVAVPARCEPGNSVTHVVRIVRRRQNAVIQQARQHGHSSEHGREFAFGSCHGVTLKRRHFTFTPEEPSSRAPQGLLYIDGPKADVWNLNLPPTKPDGGLLLQLAVQLVLPKSAIQLVSQLLPPSPEKACSQWAAVAMMFDQVKRTLMGLPRRVSLE